MPETGYRPGIAFVVVTKFNIIFNSANIPATVHQNIAYAMTQVYYNWAVITFFYFKFLFKS